MASTSQMTVPRIAVSPDHVTAFEEVSSRYCESEQARLGLLWDTNMSQSVKPVKHDKTAVLLISWAEGCGDLDTKKEVMSPLTCIPAHIGHHTYLEPAIGQPACRSFPEEVWFSR